VISLGNRRSRGGIRREKPDFEETLLIVQGEKTRKRRWAKKSGGGRRPVSV